MKLGVFIQTVFKDFIILNISEEIKMVLLFRLSFGYFYYLNFIFFVETFIMYIPVKNMYATSTIHCFKHMIRVTPAASSSTEALQGFFLVSRAFALSYISSSTLKAIFLKQVLLKLLMVVPIVHLQPISLFFMVIII